VSIDYTLKTGSHESREAGMCAMEWVAYLANEPHSDSPSCVSPVLKSFCIAFNDALPDGERQRLRPYLTRCIGTAGDGRDEERAWMATDWLVRECCPAWLDLAGLHAHAQNLRSLGTVLSAETCKQAQPALDAARTDAARTAAAWAAARAAARDAARDAAWAAAWDAARDAARNAAWAAAWAAARDAAWAAARDAARAAAWAAAWDAARNAAWDALSYEQEYDKAHKAATKVVKPTSDLLVDSAFGLLDRMLPTETVVIPEPFKAELERLCAA
jgi:hypothetical protein